MLKAKPIMILSAVFLAILGISLTFAPKEIAEFAGMGFTPIYQLQLQILGALFLGFAALNWMAKGAIIGGIYNRPIALANLTHFFIGGAALVKAVAGNIHLHYAVWVLALIYLIFAILFGILFSTHPSSTE
jgi:hypothetical protein